VRPGLVSSVLRAGLCADVCAFVEAGLAVCMEFPKGLMAGLCCGHTSPFVSTLTHILVDVLAHCSGLCGRYKGTSAVKPGVN
jgi:hypothetical protein